MTKILLILSFILTSSVMAQIACKSDLYYSSQWQDSFYGYGNTQINACKNAKYLCEKEEGKLNKKGQNIYFCHNENENKFQAECKKYFIDSDGRLIKHFTLVRLHTNKSIAMKRACSDAKVKCERYKIGQNYSSQAKCRDSI